MSKKKTDKFSLKGIVKKFKPKDFIAHTGELSGYKSMNDQGEFQEFSGRYFAKYAFDHKLSLSNAISMIAQAEKQGLKLKKNLQGIAKDSGKQYLFSRTYVQAHKKFSNCTYQGDDKLKDTRIEN
jgi:hypothetical protein